MNGLEISERPDWFVSSRKPASMRRNVVKAMSISASSHGQRSIKEFCLPPLSRSEKEKFQLYITMHYYATESSVQRVEDVHLQEAIRVPRPSKNMIPNRKKLAGELLNKCYNLLKANVDIRMEGAHLCLVTDGWSNIKNDPVINYIATSPTVCFSSSQYLLDSKVTAPIGSRWTSRAY